MPITTSLEQKLVAIDRVLDRVRVDQQQGAFVDPAIIQALKDIAIDLRAETPKEISKTLRAITHQVQSARRGKAQLGFYDHGTMQTITEALCGRWWPVIERALQHYEKEKASV